MLRLSSKQRTIHMFFRVSLFMLLVALLSVSSVCAQELVISEEAQRLAKLHGLEPNLVAGMLAAGVPAESVNQVTAAAYLSED